MTRIVLPAKLGASDLVAVMAKARGADTPIEIDFKHLRHVTPVFLAALTATVHHWEKTGRPVVFSGLEHCQITSYLQRMDFLKRCGIDLPENFARHKPQGRFLPVTEVEVRVEDLAREIAECFAPGGDDYEHPNAGFYDFLVYAVTELGNNIRQHSSGTGFTAVQASPTDGMVRLALADNGVGILRSFQRIEAPWSKNATDSEAILKAMEPRVSCKMGVPNEGVGLTILSSVIGKMKGWLMVASGTGLVTSSGGSAPTPRNFPNQGYYQGTLVALTIGRTAAASFSEHLKTTKFDKGLLPMAKPRATFES